MNRWSCWATVLILTACSDKFEEEGVPPQSGTKTGNGITLEFGALREELVLSRDGGSDASNDGSPLQFLLRGVTVQVDAAWMRVSQVEVETAGTVDCDDPLPVDSAIECASDRYRIVEPLDLDLLTATSVPDLDEYRLPPGTYRSIQLSLDAQGPAAEAVAFRVEGTLDSGLGAVPFRFDLRDPVDLTYVAVTDIDVADGGRLRAITDLARLLELNIDCLQAGSATSPLPEQLVCEPSSQAFIDALPSSTELSGEPD